MQPPLRPLATALGVVLILLLIGLGYGWYRYSDLSKNYTELLSAKTASDAYAANILAKLTDATEENAQLMDALTLERSKNGLFEEQIQNISGTVGTLTKLAKTDPELLAKYSKVYFLNENYIPSDLDQLDTTYLSDSTKDLYIHGSVRHYLEDLLQDAAEDGVTITIASAYRSFETQADLKGRYVTTYGAGANRFSADQGYSEHQLGTTVDFTTPASGGSLTGFDTTEAYPWLLKNAHRYGFVLSYPAGNAYYQYEPWHWRFVGRDLADHLHDKDLHFYDLDQRTIDEYLVSLFD